jgi:hypothetical protein
LVLAAESLDAVTAFAASVAAALDAAGGLSLFTPVPLDVPFTPLLPQLLLLLLLALLLSSGKTGLPRFGLSSCSRTSLDVLPAGSKTSPLLLPLLLPLPAAAAFASASLLSWLAISSARLVSPPPAAAAAGPASGPLLLLLLSLLLLLLLLPLLPLLLLLLLALVSLLVGEFSVVSSGMGE